jgi:hypothetical protein
MEEHRKRGDCVNELLFLWHLIYCNWDIYWTLLLENLTSKFRHRIRFVLFFNFHSKYFRSFVKFLGSETDTLHTYLYGMNKAAHARTDVPSPMLCARSPETPFLSLWPRPFETSWSRVLREQLKGPKLLNSPHFVEREGSLRVKNLYYRINKTLPRARSI